MKPYATHVAKLHSRKMDRRASSMLLVIFMKIASGMSESAASHSIAYPPVRTFKVKAPLNFAVLGDWGMRTEVQQRVAAALQVEAKHEGTSFILNVGDNFYRSHDANGGKRGGVDNVTDHIWETTFVDMYTGALAKMPILSILGNHDYMGNTSAQVEYGNLHHRWVMPGRNYTTRFISEESGDVLASIVHIDTSPMIKKYRDKPENGRMLSELEAAPSPKSQREWVHETLKALDGISGYKFVVGHHPVKVGFQENENSAKKMLKDMSWLEPLLEKHGVDAYFCGHVHNLEHTRSGKVDYFISGSGGEHKSYGNDLEDGGSWVSKVPGFLSVTLDPVNQQASYRFLDDERKTLYTSRRWAPRSHPTTTSNSKDPITHILDTPAMLVLNASDTPKEHQRDKSSFIPTLSEAADLLSAEMSHLAQTAESAGTSLWATKTRIAGSVEQLFKLRGAATVSSAMIPRG